MLAEWGMEGGGGLNEMSDIISNDDCHCHKNTTWIRTASSVSDPQLCCTCVNSADSLSISAVVYDVLDWTSIQALNT